MATEARWCERVMVLRVAVAAVQYGYESADLG